MLLRARLVHPVSAPPIPDGAVTSQDGRILEVGRFQDLSSPDGDVLDLGEVVLLPGLVNAHCHLDYTDMAGLISPPSEFTDWINAIIGIKAAWGYTDYARSWVNGARQLLQTGVTTVADTEAVPELLPEVWHTTPLRVHTFIELLSVQRLQQPESKVRAALAQIAPAEADPDRLAGGLSPHALYSTCKELLLQAAQTGLRLSVHVAESAAEDAMFRHGAGPMYRWLAGNGRDMSDCGAGSPVRRLRELGILSDRLLAIHCNHIDDADIRCLAEQDVHVVHCPRSHDYFGHTPFRMTDLLAAGINVCLATDSLASVRSFGTPAPRLSLLDEIRAAMSVHPDLRAATAWEMVTINPARALGREYEIGRIAPGARADLIALPAKDAEDAIAAREPVAVMIEGRWEKR